jgi:inosose dehydratase
MSAIRVATAPGTWGVEPIFDPAQAPWELVLDEVAQAGFDGIELGPYGYLPTDARRLAEELASRELVLAAGFVMEPLHDPAQTKRVLWSARLTCELLADAGAKTLVVIGSLVPERSRAAGRVDAAPPLEGSRLETFVRALEHLIECAADTGLTPALHPHAGTYVEFEHEIEAMLSEFDGQLSLCVDTGHCAFSGVDAGALLRRYSNRIAHIHLKDVQAGVLTKAITAEASFEQAVASGVFCALGDGDVDLASFVGALREIGYQGWATYEQDRLATDYSHALGDAERSLEHLRIIGIDNPQRVA